MYWDPNRVVCKIKKIPQPKLSWVLIRKQVSFDLSILSKLLDTTVEEDIFARLYPEEDVYW